MIVPAQKQKRESNYLKQKAIKAKAVLEAEAEAAKIFERSRSES